MKDYGYTRDEYAYVIHVEGGLCKIGYSNDPSKRATHISTYHWNLVSMVAVYAGGPSKEEALHLQFESCHVIGEWFNLPTPTIVKLYQSMPDRSPVNKQLAHDWPKEWIDRSNRALGRLYAIRKNKGMPVGKGNHCLSDNPEVTPPSWRVLV